MNTLNKFEISKVTANEKKYQFAGAEGYTFDTQRCVDTWCGFGIGYRGEIANDGTFVSSC
ncbi:MAG: hypothetical protein WBP08_02600 [Saprospiraceae bacterium]|nr:hypothetical protein [Saprospiraceae bacterium]